MARTPGLRRHSYITRIPIAVAALLIGTTNVHADRTPPRLPDLEEKVGAAQFVVIARVKRFQYFKFDNQPGASRRGVYLGEDNDQRNPSVSKYEEIEVLRVLYPQEWRPKPPLMGALGISWYPDPTRKYYAGDAQVYFFNGTKARMVVDGFFEDDTLLLQTPTVRGIAAVPEPLEALSAVESLVRRRIESGATPLSGAK